MRHFIFLLLIIFGACKKYIQTSDIAIDAKVPFSNNGVIVLYKNNALFNTYHLSIDSTWKTDLFEIADNTKLTVVIIRMDKDFNAKKDSLFSNSFIRWTSHHTNKVDMFKMDSLTNSISSSAIIVRD